MDELRFFYEIHSAICTFAPTINANGPRKATKRAPNGALLFLLMESKCCYRERGGFRDGLYFASFRAIFDSELRPIILVRMWSKTCKRRAFGQVRSELPPLLVCAAGLIYIGDHVYKP